MFQPWKSSILPVWGTVIIFFLMIPFHPVTAQLLSPGTLGKAHRHLEGIENCRKCHSGDKEIDPGKCMDCHQSIGADWTSGQGYHGWLKINEKKTCIQCHSDHNGLNFEMVRWLETDKTRLNHSKTGYELIGAHRKATCESCHQPANHSEKLRKADQSIQSATTYLALTTQCLSCHFDEHRGTLGESCEDCHDLENWKKATLFDHTKTKYPLTGNHQTVKCASCHQPVKDEKVWRDQKDGEYLQMDRLKFPQCLSCHQNPHPPGISTACESCHNTTGWKNTSNQTKFDHGTTRYPLTGEHRSLNCSACHFTDLSKATSDLKKLVIPNFQKKSMAYQSCTDCHQDAHKKQLMKNGQLQPCEDCHTTSGFRPSTYSTAQHQQTAFPLTGAHQVAACIECHHPSGTGDWIFTSLEKSCQGCHHDAHKGEADPFMTTGKNGKPDCESCHVTSEWKVTRFDHSVTEFALNGRHQSVSCISCHKREGKKPGTIRFQTTARDCNSCHEDIHNGQFTESGKVLCQKCHTENDWLATRFEHNRDSRYKLDGAHEQVPCKSCHQTERTNGKELVRFKPMEVTCESCHRI
ncbi:MAG: hypothetical protein HUU10_12505 [Bacteroidetes bacterium]|nr:hypothetical protein [Bacteroidota bacterium]